MPRLLLPLLVLPLAACVSAPTISARPAPPRSSLEPDEIQMPPTTIEPSWLAPLPGASVLELPGGEDGRPERVSRWSHGVLEDGVTRAQDGTVREQRHRTPDGLLHDRVLWSNGKTEAEGLLDGVLRAGDWRFAYPDGATSCEQHRASDGSLRATQYALDGKVLGTVERASNGQVRLTGTTIVDGRGDPCW